METIAVYWEPRIKTYGLKDILGLSMLKLKIRAERLEEWGLIIHDEARFPFKLVLMNYLSEHELGLDLVFEAGQEQELIAPLDGFLDGDQNETLDILSPVEMVYFFGPHFGDRYGIASSAVSVLHAGNLPVLALACSVSFIYLVLAEGTAFRAKEILTEKFEIP